MHLVCYFRYYRFLRGERLLYRISPEIPSKVVASMRSEKDKNKSSVDKGHFNLDYDKLECVVEYQGEYYIPHGL